LHPHPPFVLASVTDTDAKTPGTSNKQQHEQPDQDEEDPGGGKDELYQCFLLIKQVGEAFHQLTELGCPMSVRDICLNALLVDANRACRILRGLADTAMAASGLGYILPLKAKMHQILGQHALALDASQEADGILIAEEKKENKTNNLAVLCEMGYVFLNMNQLEASKRSFLRILARPGLLEANHRMNAFHGLARCHKERQDWVQTI